MNNDEVATIASRNVEFDDATPYGKERNSYKMGDLSPVVSSGDSLNSDPDVPT